MNRKVWIALAAAALSIFVLAACNGADKNSDETGTGTAAGTTAETEAVTAIPRYDYMAADVIPDVEIDPSIYSDMQLTIPNSYKIEDEDVEDYIKNIRFQYRTAVNGTTTVKDQALSMGDDAFIYYKGLVDGQEFDGGSNWDDKEPYKLGLGSGAFIPGFEEALVGIVPNETSKSNPASITVTFPEEYTESLAGKEATFYIVVEYSVQYTMAELTRDFILVDLEYETQKEFYASDSALFTEFKAYVKDDLINKMQTDIENAKIDAIWNYLTENATCKNLPATEVQYYADSYQSEVEYYYNYYSSYGGESFTSKYPDAATFAAAYYRLAADTDWETEKRNMAEQMVRKDMITHAIGELEGIESVTDEEYRAQIDYWVNYYYGYMTAAEIEANMGSVFLTESAFADKMQEWLFDHVTFTFEDGSDLPVYETEQ